jgi:hypothetical protein
MTIERDEIPEEWYDPRLCDDFYTMTNFEQVSALFEFKAKVLRKLREPLSDLAVHRVDVLLEAFCILNDIQNISDSTAYVRAGALKRLIQAFTDVAADHFTHYGVKFLCLDFLKEEGGNSFLRFDIDSETMDRMVEAIKG